MSIVFVDSPVLGTGAPEFPLSHARILYSSLLERNGQTVATDGDPEFPARAALNPLTYEAWRPSSMPAEWSRLWSVAQRINAVGIAGHNLATRGTEVTLELLVDGDWASVHSVVPKDNGPILFLFPATEVSAMRLHFQGGDAPAVSVIYAGMTLDMMRPIYGGHSPGALSRKTVIVGSRSEGGQALGWQVQREGTQSQYSWKHLKAGWYRENFDPFVEYATRNSGYFFIAWRPADYPDEVQYGSVTGDIKPSNMGIRDYMQVDITVTGVGPAGRSY